MILKDKDLSPAEKRRMHMENLERTRKAIFEKYPNAVVDFEYDWGEILFYPDAEKSDNDENLHSGYIRKGRLVDVTDF